MNERKIRISSLQEVKCVVGVASTSHFSIEARDALGQVADASSILGMLSLDYQHPVGLRSRDEESLEAICESLAEKQ